MKAFRLLETTKQTRWDWCIQII